MKTLSLTVSLSRAALTILVSERGYAAAHLLPPRATAPRSPKLVEARTFGDFHQDHSLITLGLRTQF